MDVKSRLYNIPIGVQQTIYNYLNDDSKHKLLKANFNIIYHGFQMETIDKLINIGHKYNKISNYCHADIDIIMDGYLPCDCCNIIINNLYKCKECDYNYCIDCLDMKLYCSDCGYFLWDKYSLCNDCNDCTDSNKIIECQKCNLCCECGKRNGQNENNKKCICCNNITCNDCYTHKYEWSSFEHEYECDECCDILCKQCRNKYSVNCPICNEKYVWCQKCIEIIKCDICIETVCPHCHFTGQCYKCNDNLDTAHCIFINGYKKLLCDTCHDKK
jgi:hypothetical protein